MSSTATASALPFGAKPAEKKKNSTVEVVAASMVGTAIEFYDNYCYSIAAASYFGLIFFTDVAKSNPVWRRCSPSSPSLCRFWRVRSARFCSGTSATSSDARKPWSQHL